MSRDYHLSVAGVKILVRTEQPLHQNTEFLPFLIEGTEPDMQMDVRRADTLPQIPQKPIYSDIFCAVTRNEEGFLQKLYFDGAEGSYSVSTYHPDGKYILMEYASSELDLQHCFYCLGFEEYLLRNDKLCLHASCVDTPVGGILFSGVSGIGKSTQADLWCKYRGAKQINGDRPILSKDDHGWVAWGSPYAGSSKVYVNESCKITAIVLLKQAGECSLRKLSAAEAFRGIWAGLTVRTWDADFVDRASELAIELATNVPVYEFACTPDEEAVKFLEEELRKENGK